jgi:hypothetical protein
MGCYVCIRDEFYNKRDIGSIYGNPDPLMARKKKYKRLIKGQSVSWVDPCSRNNFIADAEGRKVNQEETAVFKKLLIGLGVSESKIKGLTLSELVESYELYVKKQRKSEQAGTKKARVVDIPVTHSRPVTSSEVETLREEKTENVGALKTPKKKAGRPSKEQ